ncbi:MAG: polysaccharide biosynthesis tyrosine autokinase, partial [bacterium]
DYASLLSAYLDVRTMKSRLLGLVIAEPAQPPTEPIRPRKAMNTAVATASGGLIGLVLVFGMDYLTDSLESTEDVRQALSLPNLGSIPVVNSWRKNGISRVTATHPAAEAFRVLRTNVRFASAGIDTPVRSLMFTSAAPAEGKTSIVANLGVVTAQAGRQVLLVDADLRHPRLHDVFDVPGQVGLASLLVDDADPENGIVDTGIDNLRLMPAGTSPPNPSEILGSQRMKRLIDELSDMADVVFFDAPPTLAGADAMVLAAQVDGVIVVVDSNSTRREAAKRALELLQNADATVLGSVLNKARTGTVEYYYSDNGEQLEPLWQRWTKLLKTEQSPGTTMDWLRRRLTDLRHVTNLRKKQDES